MYLFFVKYIDMNKEDIISDIDRLLNNPDNTENQQLFDDKNQNDIMQQQMHQQMPRPILLPKSQQNLQLVSRPLPQLKVQSLQRQVPPRT